MTERQLELACLHEPGAAVELVDGELAEASVTASVRSPPPPPDRSELAQRNLFAEADRIAARAASASTRRQYAAIFRSFESAECQRCSEPIQAPPPLRAT